VNAPKAPAAVLERETIELATRMARNSLTIGLGAHFVFGPVGHALDRVAAAAPRVVPVLGTFTEHLGVTMLTRSATARSTLRTSARALRKELRAAGRAAETADVKAALSYLETVENTWAAKVPVRRPTGEEASVLLRIQATLDDAARRGRTTPDLLRLDSAYANWQVALRRQNRQEAEKAAGELSEAARRVYNSPAAQAGPKKPTAITAPPRPGQAKAITDEISQATRHALQTTPSEEGLRVLLTLDRAASTADDETRRAYQWLVAYVKERGELAGGGPGNGGDMWVRIGNLVASANTPTEWKQVGGLLSTVQGALGELLARSQPAYQAARRSAMREAEQLAKDLGPPWQVCSVPLGLQAPTRNRAALELFYDDSVHVINPQTNTSMTLFAAEFKTGENGGNDILEQIAKAQPREATGQIFFNGTLWDNAPPPPAYTTRRVAVSPTVTSGATRARVSFRGEVAYDALLMERDQLRKVAMLFLRAGGKLPAGSP
jgi:hypothetical protein